MRTATDNLIERYMRELHRELRSFPASQRREITDEVREHIYQARAELDTENEAAIRTVLDRLGDPNEIAASARERFGVRPARAGAIEIWTVIALVVPYIGWLIGTVLVWMSRVWRTRDKMLTTILVPGTWILFFLSTLAVSVSVHTVSGRTCQVDVDTGKTMCERLPAPPRDAGGFEWGTLIFVATFVIPVATAIYLAIRARRLSEATA